MLTRDHKHLAFTLSTLCLDEGVQREAQAVLERLPDQTAEFLRQMLNTNYHYLPQGIAGTWEKDPGLTRY